jgi:predicted HTH transcriptional regulator
MLDAGKINILIKEGEGLTVECKERYTPKIDRDIVAFANSKGGLLLLGVDDGGKVVGEKLTNKMKAEINTIARNCDPRYSLKADRFQKVGEAGEKTRGITGEKIRREVGEKVGEKLTKNRQKIIDYILQNKNISSKELAELVGISQRKMEKNISWLKEKGLIKRIGHDKGGHWEIVSD